jgi:hypothetical protein
MSRFLNLRKGRKGHEVKDKRGGGNLGTESRSAQNIKDTAHPALLVG